MLLISVLGVYYHRGLHDKSFFLIDGNCARIRILVRVFHCHLFREKCERVQSAMLPQRYINFMAPQYVILVGLSSDGKS